MPPPETTAPSTSPDATPGNTLSSEEEAALKRMSDGELRAYWHDYIVTQLRTDGNLEEYASATGDAEFENKINSIIDQEVNELAENPELAKVDAYALHVKQPSPTQPSDKNVANAADPVNLFNGNFVYSSQDFQLNGAGFDFVFQRTYAQLSIYSGPLGFNWDHNYNLWLRISEDTTIIHRSNGTLGEETYRKHEHFGYWVPPNGMTGIILENGNSFVLRFPNGSKIFYQPHQTLHPFIHVVARIEDRFGNHLNFLYSDGLLVRAQVNHPHRILDFQYDTQNRITSIRDFSGRIWRYDYDDLGDLVAVTTPATTQHKKGLTTCYEYIGSLHSDINLQHNLISITDADGRLYLENEYGSVPNLLSYGRVIRQRQGSGDFFFDYADVIEDFDFPYETHERPTHQTIVTERDGRQGRYLFNRLGNMIFKEEYARLDGLPKLISSHYRYNRDGNLIGMISPLGAITQSLYGRDVYERQFPPDNDYRPETDPNLTLEARLQFEHLLAVVKRAKYYDVNALNLAGGLWSADLFPDILDTNDQDVIQKFTYEPEFSQPLTVSDPRFTKSADPAFSEDAEYHRRLTKYSYAPSLGFQHLFLEAVELPTPVLPDGILSAPVITRFAEFDQNGRIIKIIAPNGLETLNSYSQPAEGIFEGFLKSTTIDASGFDVKRGMERDQLGRVVKLFRPQFFDFNDDRFFSTAEYNELSQSVKLVGSAPFSISTHNSYTRAGNLLRSEMDLKDHTHTLVGSFVTTNRYDEEFNLVAQKIGDAEDNAIKQTKVVFDQASRPFLFITPCGRKRKTTFNERSLIAKTIQDYGEVHAVTRGYYDADGRLIRVIDPRGSVTKFVYDALGRLVDTEDAKGNRIIRHFDKLGNLLSECLYEKQSENAFVLLFRREFSYDELGRMIVAGVNKFEPPSEIAADQLRSAFKEVGPGELLTIKSFYDNVGNLVKEVDQDGREFVSEYDILGRIITKIDPNGNEIRLKYDKEGNVLRVDRKEVTRDPITNTAISTRHFAEVFTYDELNRLVERKTSIGDLRYKYDSRGNLVKIIDPMGNKIENVYDIFSRLIENRQLFHRHETGDVLVPVKTFFSYDLDDQKINQTDALGRITRFNYDSAGRLTSTILPDESSDSFRYDRFGNLTEHRDRNGLIKQLGWDELNRNIELRIDASALISEVGFAGAVDYRYVYDALDRLKTAENDFVINSFTYNSLNHLLEEVTSFTAITGINPTNRYVIKRDFSNSGAVISLTYPSGREIRYSRDILDRVVKIEQTQKGNNYPGDPATSNNLTIADINYEGLQIQKISRHNGISTEFLYDFSSRIVEIRHSKGSHNVLTLQFLYDALGNMRQKIEVAEDFQSTESFKYDSLSRLFEAKKSGTASLLDLALISPPSEPLPSDLPNKQSQIDQLISTPNAHQTTIYNYDLVGNRISRVFEGVDEIYQTNELDQYFKVDVIPLQYDENGNLVEDDTFRYGYDHRNQLTKIVKKANVQETKFVFDCFGRRTLQIDGTRSKIFLYDGHSLLEQHDENQLIQTVVSNMKQDDLLVSSGSGKDYYLLSDLTRSVRYIFDGADKHNFYIYDEFGNLRDSLIPTDDNPFRFAGKRLLGDTGKYDFIYRTYDPSLGKFIQRDPKGFADGINLYTFLRNNPLTLTDSLGLESRTEQASRAEPHAISPAAPLAARFGAELAYRNPKGFTLAVPNNFDNDKIRAYKERINNPTDRGVGIRSRPPGAKTSTADIRQANLGLRSAYEASLPGGTRPTGTQIDHTVELQNIIRGNDAPGADTVRPQDHRVQDSRLNASQGSQAQKVKARQVQAGAPLDTPAGGVARVKDINKVWNREGYRTGMRYFGYYNLVGGTFASLSSIGDDIREGNFGSAALNTSGYLGGAFEIGGIAARSSTLLNAGRFLGAPAAVVGSGVIGVRIGTNLYENYVDKEMSLDAGSWVEEKTGSRILGATAAAAVAVGDGIVHAPEAAYDYVVDNMTLDPDEIDWDRTFKPWKWF